jgi:PIN domain nuclease of toxin-antitoxin system
MNYLLDTHVFIWMDSDPSQLSVTVEELLKDKKNAIYISVVSVWRYKSKPKSANSL